MLHLVLYYSLSRFSHFAERVNDGTNVPSCFFRKQASQNAFQKLLKREWWFLLCQRVVNGNGNTVFRPEIKMTRVDFEFERQMTTRMVPNKVSVNPDDGRVVGAAEPNFHSLKRGRSAYSNKIHTSTYGSYPVVLPRIWDEKGSLVPGPSNEITQSLVSGYVIVAGRHWHGVDFADVGEFWQPLLVPLLPETLVGIMSSIGSQSKIPDTIFNWG